MAEEDNKRQEQTDEKDNLLARFPAAPTSSAIPEAPKLSAPLPPHSTHKRPGTVEPGSYNKAAIAMTAASSFIMPIIALSVLGWWLDGKLHHSTDWLAFIGVLLGLVVGVSALLRVLNRLSD